MANLRGYEQLMARFKALNGAGSKSLMGTLGMAAVSESKLLEAPHRRTGNLGRTVHVAAVTATSVTIEASANYAAVFQFGSKPHTITPNAAKALRWAGTGGARLTGTPTKAAQRSGNLHFARVVHHPGTKPYPFVIEGSKAAVQKSGADTIVSIWNSAA